MTCKIKLLVGGFLLLLVSSSACAVTGVPSVERVLQHGLPDQPAGLEKLSGSLFQDYGHTGNLAALVFYSYSLLSLANHYEQSNDYVRASGLVKAGFFYLDEAVDAHEENWRVRYLRARMDAWLPKKLGRCVVTLADTRALLEVRQHYDETLLAHVQYMRYRALKSCRQLSEQPGLLSALRQGSQVGRILLSGGGSAPAWAASEVANVLLPLAREE